MIVVFSKKCQLPVFDNEVMMKRDVGAGILKVVW
jgi:hypothetical protein